VPYFIGKKMMPPKRSTEPSGPGTFRFYRAATVRGERYRSRKAAEQGALELWPDEATYVIKALNSSQALARLTGQPYPAWQPDWLTGLERRLVRRFGRNRLVRRFGRNRVYPLPPSRPPSGDDGAGSREPRRPLPGGLSSSAARRLEDDDPATPAEDGAT
jgi:hypothetical protein